MSYLLILAAAKAAQDRRNRARRAANRRREEERKREEEKRKQSSYYSSRRDSKSYFECLKIEVSDDKELLDFFSTLERSIQTVRRKKGAEYEEKAKEFSELMQKYDKERQKIVERLTESGIQLSDTRYVSSGLEYFKIDEESDEYRSSYRNPDEMPIARKFNGLYLTEKMLENPDDTTYKDRYEEKRKIAEEKRTKKEELEKELKKIEFRLKIPFTDKYELQEKARNIRSQIEDCERDFEKEEFARQELETFEALTDDQKKDILAYIKSSDSIIEAGNVLSSLKRQFESSLPREDSKEVVEEALGKVIEETGLDEEGIYKIFMKMDRVAIRRQRGEYEGRSIPYYRSPVSKLEKAMNGFMRHIYEEDDGFVERNMEEVLEDEETRE